MKHFKHMMLAVALTLVVGCVSVNPLKTAATAVADNRPETIAFASYAMFVIVEEAAADVKEMAGTPVAVKEALKAADVVASPAAESLRDAATTIRGLRAVVAGGGPNGTAASNQLATKILELNKLLTETAPKLQRLTDAYAKAKVTK